MDKEGKFCGFVWFIIPKLIINLKRRSQIESKKVKKEPVKKNEGSKDEGSESESDKSENND